VAGRDSDDLFICADDEDRPKHLYERLGFRPAWTMTEFLRLPGSHRPLATALPRSRRLSQTAKVTRAKRAPAQLPCARKATRARWQTDGSAVRLFARNSDVLLGRPWCALWRAEELPGAAPRHLTCGDKQSRGARLPDAQRPHPDLHSLTR
jgi:hypothetical protein